MADAIEASTRIVRLVGDARFSRGLFCVRCGSGRVVGWGRYRERERFRCRACRRTFNVLTDTPFAYSKRLECWLPYLRLMRGQATLRRAALQLDIHLSTSFRWRHRLLEAPSVHQHRLQGHVELGEALFAYSEKGTRRSQRSAHDGGGCADRVERNVRRRVRVLLLRARSGEVASRVMVTNVPVTALITEALTSLVDSPATVLSSASRMSPYGAAVLRSRNVLWSTHPAARTGAPGALLHTRNVVVLERRLRKWLLPFRGVATKYLKNYLAWHRIADRDEVDAWEYSFVARSTDACPGLVHISCEHGARVARAPPGG